MSEKTERALWGKNQFGESDKKDRVEDRIVIPLACG